VAEAPGAIEARLSAFDTAMVVFSLVVGIGIFRTPSIVAQAAGSTGLFFGAWVAAGAISLIGALTFAEIGSRYPRVGGFYDVVAHCYHPAIAFMLNWAQTLMQGASAAGVAFIGADYLAPVILPPSLRGPHETFVLACTTMLVLLALNWRGIRTGARAQNLLSLLKIAMIVGLAVCALLLAPHAAANVTAVANASGALPAANAPAPAPLLARFASALVPCFYAYGGYQLTMNLAADLKDARRSFALAVAAGVITVVTLYLLINFAYFWVLGTAGIAGSSLVAATLSRATFGAAGEVVVSLAVFLSATGFVNAMILQIPRSFHAMAANGVLPRAFMRVNPRTQANQAGLLFFGATMLLPAFLLGSFEKLLNYVIFTDTLSIAVVASTLFALRHRREGDGAFAMPGYPLLPALFVAVLLGVAGTVLVNQPGLALAGTIIMLAGWPLFRLGQRLSR
jgi:APA family basic amino acid/polyamine antiporter